MNSITVVSEQGETRKAHYTPGGTIPGTGLDRLGTWRLDDGRPLTLQKSTEKRAFKTEDGVLWTED